MAANRQQAPAGVVAIPPERGPATAYLAPVAHGHPGRAPRTGGQLRADLSGPAHSVSRAELMYLTRPPILLHTRLASPREASRLPVLAGTWPPGHVLPRATKVRRSAAQQKFAAPLGRPASAVCATKVRRPCPTTVRLRRLLGNAAAEPSRRLVASRLLLTNPRRSFGGPFGGPFVG